MSGIILFLTFCLPVAAQLPPPRVGVTAAQTKLTLAEAVERALRNNLELEIEKTRQASAVEAVRAGKGFLDPVLRWQPNLEKRTTPTPSVLAGAGGKLVENILLQSVSVRKQTGWKGVSLRADFDNTRQSTNNPFLSLNPFFAPRLVLGFSAPLLRDRQTDRDRTELVVRRKQAAGADVDFQLRVIDVVSRVEQAYYDLVAARADVEVARESVALAQQQLERTQRLIEGGTLAPIELAASEAELERRKDSYFSAVNGLSRVENQLKQLLAGGRTDPLWSEEILPLTEGKAEPAWDAPWDLEAAVKQALDRRVEFKALAIRSDINQMQKDLALNQRKPQLVLSGAYVQSGLAGTALANENPFSSFSRLLAERINALSANAGLAPLPVQNFGGGVPVDFAGGYARSLGNLFSGNYQGFQAGLTLDFTFRNQAAESALAQTAITERRLALERKLLEQAVEAQVRNALQAVATSKQRIAAAEASVKAAREKLDSEIRLFQTGESTNFLVLTRQNEFSDSRRRLVQATLEYNKSLAQLALALGGTLERYNIQLR